MEKSDMILKPRDCYKPPTRCSRSWKKFNNSNGYFYWFTCGMCEAGFLARPGQVASGKTKSCGCFRSSRLLNHGHARKRNKSLTYVSWASIRQRCGNSKNPAYQYYGGAGITYDPRWEVFEAFLKDMGERPGADYSIDRMDASKGYYSENCEWVLKKENSKKVSESNERDSDGKFTSS